MKRIHIFFINIFILTISSLIIQSIVLWFNGFLTKIIGAECIGLYHLLLSIYGISVTMATAGINLAVTRLVAEKQNSVMKSAFLYSLFFSIVTTAALITFSNFIGANILKDIRTIKPIKIFALSMPLISLSSVFNGYFVAKKQVIKTSISQMSETIIKIITTIILLKFSKIKTPENFCVILVSGNLAGDIVSLLFFILFYKKQQTNSQSYIFRKIFGISIPVAISSLIRTALNSYKQIIVPENLKKFGMSSDNALSYYGCINGMVMPIIAFPMNILYTCSNMLIPEIASCNNNIQIKKIVKKAINTTAYFSIMIFISCIFFYKKICLILYGTNNCGHYLLIMSPIILTMYIDAVCDGLLKALNLQTYSMKLNILDSIICIVLIPVLVKNFGIYGYISVIYVSEIFNTTLSLYKLRKSL